MVNPPAKTKRKKPLILTERDEKILRAICTYRYMTGKDVAALLFKLGSKTHVIEILGRLSGGKDLEKREYLLRSAIPKRGNSERFFTLGAKGRRYLLEQGIPVTSGVYPSKLATFSYGHLQHNLILTRFVVALTIWSRTQSAFRLLKVRFGFEFRRQRIVPDAWILLERRRNKNTIPVFRNRQGYGVREEI
jgi:hypothetical protein